MHERLAVNGDLPTWAAALACVLAIASLGVLLVVELRRRERGGPLIVATGVFAVIALLAAIARPVRIAARESVIGPKVIVLSDVSRSMALPQNGKSPRAEIARPPRSRSVRRTPGSSRSASAKARRSRSPRRQTRRSPPPTRRAAI
jgi:hypothetical protein